MDSATDHGGKTALQRRCPFCASQHVYRRHRRGPVDYTLSALGLFPYSCGECKKDFRAARSRRRPARQGPRAGVICPRCAGDMAVRIPSVKVTPRLGNFLWRKVGIPGYRCPKCRMRFFSLRRPARSRA